VRDSFGLFLIVGKAAIMITGGCFVLLLMAVLIGFRPEPLSVEKAILGAVILLLPTGVAVWWTFRKLRKRYSRREARTVCIAFAVFAPVSLLVGFGLGPLFGYVQISGVPRVIGALSVFMGIAFVTAVLSFLVCAFVLRMTRLAISVEQGDRP
jgi:hypothetical protein